MTPLSPLSTPLSRVARALYRELLPLAAQLDVSLVTRLSLANAAAAAVAAPGATGARDGSAAAAGARVLAFLGVPATAAASASGEFFYAPPAAPRSAVRALSDAFRDSRSTAVDGVDEALAALRLLRAAAAAGERAPDTSLPAGGSGRWATVLRARAASRTASAGPPALPTLPASALAPGTLLLAHPALDGTPFGRAVVLLVDAAPSAARGALGVNLSLVGGPRPVRELALSPARAGGIAGTSVEASVSASVASDAPRVSHAIAPSVGVAPSVDAVDSDRVAAPVTRVSLLRAPFDLPSAPPPQHQSSLSLPPAAEPRPSLAGPSHPSPAAELAPVLALMQSVQAAERGGVLAPRRRRSLAARLHAAARALSPLARRELAFPLRAGDEVRLSYAPPPRWAVSSLLPGAAGGAAGGARAPRAAAAAGREDDDAAWKALMTALSDDSGEGGDDDDESDEVDGSDTGGGTSDGGGVGGARGERGGRAEGASFYASAGVQAALNEAEAFFWKARHRDMPVVMHRSPSPDGDDDGDDGDGSGGGGRARGVRRAAADEDEIAASSSSPQSARVGGAAAAAAAAARAARRARRAHTRARLVAAALYASAAADGAAAADTAIALVGAGVRPAAAARGVIDAAAAAASLHATVLEGPLSDPRAVLNALRGLRGGDERAGAPAERPPPGVVGTDDDDNDDDDDDRSAAARSLVAGGGRGPRGASGDGEDGHDDGGGGGEGDDFDDDDDDAGDEASVPVTGGVEGADREDFGATRVVRSLLIDLDGVDASGTGARGGGGSGSGGGGGGSGVVAFAPLPLGPGLDAPAPRAVRAAQDAFDAARWLSASRVPVPSMVMSRQVVGGEDEDGEGAAGGDGEDDGDGGEPLGATIASPREAFHTLDPRDVASGGRLLWTPARGPLRDFQDVTDAVPGEAAPRGAGARVGRVADAADSAYDLARLGRAFFETGDDDSDGEGDPMASVGGEDDGDGDVDAPLMAGARRGAGGGRRRAGRGPLGLGAPANASFAPVAAGVWPCAPRRLLPAAAAGLGGRGRSPARSSARLDEPPSLRWLRRAARGARVESRPPGEAPPASLAGDWRLAARRRGRAARAAADAARGGSSSADSPRPSARVVFLSVSREGADAGAGGDGDGGSDDRGGAGALRAGYAVPFSIAPGRRWPSRASAGDAQSIAAGASDAYGALLGGGGGGASARLAAPWGRRAGAGGRSALVFALDADALAGGGAGERRELTAHLVGGAAALPPHAARRVVRRILRAWAAGAADASARVTDDGRAVVRGGGGGGSGGGGGVNSAAASRRVATEPPAAAALSPPPATRDAGIAVWSGGPVQLQHELALLVARAAGARAGRPLVVDDAAAAAVPGGQRLLVAAAAAVGAAAAAGAAGVSAGAGGGPAAARLAFESAAVWRRGQLQRELAAGAWTAVRVAEPELAAIVAGAAGADGGGALWARLVARLGGERGTLQALVTLNSGTVRSNESYAYFPIACQYLEPENVTSAQSSWGEGGSCAYLYRVDSPPAPPGSCNASAPEPGMDRPGGDFAATPLPTDSSAACEALCCAEDNCASWTYVPSAPAVFLGCAVGDHCCYQKGHTTPSPSSDPGIVSGTVARPLPSLSHPPAGMRSAVPLGGLGAGALELRADGTVHEVTIVNQSPAGAAKFGTLENLVVGVRANGVARALRTHAPPYAAGVDALTYSGAYPASRLRADDAGLAAAGVAVELVAFSKLSPGDVDASGLPAVVFSLLVTNNNNAAVNASAYVSLPWGGVNDCARPPVKGASAGTTVPAASAAACAAACAAAAGAPGRCGSWTFDPAAAGGAACVLVNDVAWSVYARGQTCGVSGAWGAPAAPGGGAPLSFSAGATHPASPASGGVTLRGVAEAARGGGAPPVPAAASYAVADDPAALWAAFAAAGALGGGAPGVTPAPFAPGAPGQVGAAAVTALVPAGATVALSVVFAWYFPHRDHMNVVVGNRYGGRFDSSDAVAAALASTPALSAAAADINALHAVFAGPLSPLPLYLQDAVINQMSHFRGMIATADGRFREFEAFDCPDVDSIHNDYQRHLPYLWLFPEFEQSKIVAWGNGQPSDGFIYEYLGSFGLGPLDQPGGRIMGDTTTLWLLELLELYRGTGDAAFLSAWWPTAQRAAAWQAGAACVNAGVSQGVPYKLVCTYDIINFAVYNATTFNSMLHLTAMAAVAELAAVMGDAATGALASAALAAGQAATQRLLWNSTSSYFRAYTGGDAVMGDALYGTMLALHHGLGWLLPGGEAAAAAHLAAELAANGDAYGIKVVTGRHTAPPAAPAAPAARAARSRRAAAAAAAADGRAAHGPPAAELYGARARAGNDSEDDVLWMGAAPDWSYVKLAAAAAEARAGGDAHAPLPPAVLAAALEPASRSFNNVRARLADSYNIAGIYTPADWTAGAARAAAAAGVRLTGRVAVGARSGARVDAAPADPADVINGLPYTTSHYGFFLTNYYLVPALSGQRADVPGGALTFSPLVGCPYVLPLTLPGTLGTVACAAAGPTQRYTLALAFGALELPAGGLAVAGSAYAGPVSLGPGDEVSWVA